MRTFISRDIEFDSGHRVPNHDSACRNTHGHRYKVEVVLSGPLQPEGNGASDEGMVLDFKEIKLALQEEIHDRFDHKFIKAETDELFNFYDFESVVPADPDCLLGPLQKIDCVGLVQELKCVPTAENLAFICYRLLSRRLDKHGVLVESVKLWETPTCSAEVFRQTRSKVKYQY